MYKRIVLFNTRIQMGGASRVIVMWANYFSDAGFDIEVVTNNQKSPFYKLNKNIIFSKIGIEDTDTIFTKIIKFIRFFKNRNDEIMIFNKGFYTPYLFLLRKLGFLKNIELVYFTHGGSSEYKIFYNKLQILLIYTTYDKIICLYDDFDKVEYKTKLGLHNFTVDKIFKKNNYNKEKTYFINNPVTFKTNHYSNLEKKQVIAFGRLEHRKGFDLLLNAWIDVVKKHKDWKLIILGSGEELNNLKQICNIKRLNKSVNFIPQQQDVIPYLLESSIFVMPSRVEEYGLVTLEAMECGLPIVAFKNFGSLLLLNNKDNNLLCELEDIKCLSSCIIKLIENKTLREEMGKKSKELAKEFYIENLAYKWDRILNG